MTESGEVLQSDATPDICWLKRCHCRSRASHSPGFVQGTKGMPAGPLEGPTSAGIDTTTMNAEAQGATLKRSEANGKGNADCHSAAPCTVKKENDGQQRRRLSSNELETSDSMKPR